MSDTDKTEALRPDAALNEMLYMALRDAQTLGDKSRVEAAAAVIRAALAQRQEVPSDHRTVWDRPCYKCRMTTCDGSSCAAPPAQQQEANNDEVICPSCAHQFRAIPVNVQRLMLEAGFEPPFTEPPAQQSDRCDWCCGTGRFADHACRFCGGKAKGSVFTSQQQQIAQPEQQEPQAREPARTICGRRQGLGGESSSLRTAGIKPGPDNAGEQAQGARSSLPS